MSCRQSVNSNGTELEQVVHTHRTLYRSSWSRGFGSSQSQSILLNIYFRLSGFQSSFSAYSLPLWSKYQFALHQIVAQNLIRHVTLSFGTASLRYRNSAEITVLMLWTEVLSGMGFVLVQKLWDIVWILPNNMSLLQTWLTKKSKFSAEGIPRQNIPTDTRGKANFLGTVEARRIIKETVSVYRNLKKKKKKKPAPLTVFCDCVLWIAPGTSCINSNVTLNVTRYSGLPLFEGRGQPYKRRLTSTRFGAVILRRRHPNPPVYTMLMV